MIVITNNIFFQLGIGELMGDLPTLTDSASLVFHTDCCCTYLLGVGNIKDLHMHDPFFIFLSCYRIEGKQKKIKSIIKDLLLKQSHASVIMKRDLLTKNELCVMVKISHGLSQRIISEQLKVSEKTISNQKINALRKLNVNKSARFFVEYLAWLKLWREYISNEKYPENAIQHSILMHLH